MKKNIISLDENTSLKIESAYHNYIQQFITENKNLPIYFKDGVLSFKPYTIGSITIKDLVINIVPRIKNLTINHYFEMFLYNENLLLSTSLLNENKQLGIQDTLINSFLSELNLLVKLGLEGDFEDRISVSNKIRGRILLNLITPLNLLEGQLPIQYNDHTLETIENKIIKLALDKVFLLTQGNYAKRDASLLMPYFDYLSVSQNETLDLLDLLNSKKTYVNKHYPTVILLAKKILLDLKVNMKAHSLLGSSYLVNSNTIFENYVQAILKRNLYVKVEKWSKNEKFGEMIIKDKIYTKSYSPDILINYNEKYKTALAILDTKNKDISDYTNIARTEDIYQVLFYSHILKTKFAGLIYPYYGHLDTIHLEVNSFTEIKFHIFNLDFSLPLQKRHKFFLEQIYYFIDII